MLSRAFPGAEKQSVGLRVIFFLLVFWGYFFFNTGNLYPSLYQRPVFFTAVLSLSVPLTDPTGEMGPYVQDQFYGTAPLFPKQCGP